MGLDAGSRIYLRLSTLRGKRKHLVTYSFIGNLNARVLNMLHISETYVSGLGCLYDGRGRSETGCLQLPPCYLITQAWLLKNIFHLVSFRRPLTEFNIAFNMDIDDAAIPTSILPHDLLISRHQIRAPGRLVYDDSVLLPSNVPTRLSWKLPVNAKSMLRVRHILFFSYTEPKPCLVIFRTNASFTRNPYLLSYPSVVSELSTTTMKHNLTTGTHAQSVNNRIGPTRQILIEILNHMPQLEELTLVNALDPNSRFVNIPLRAVLPCLRNLTIQDHIMHSKNPRLPNTLRFVSETVMI